MGIVYHGSSVGGLKTIAPHQSTHGNYVYATPEKLISLFFTKKDGDDMTYTLLKNGSSNEPWALVERIPNGFAKMFNNSASIYTINDDTFIDLQTGFNEVGSEKEVTVLNEERIDNVYEEIQKFAKEGKIKLYHYPNRPKEIPDDDNDLLQKELKHLKRINIPITKNSLYRLLLLRPNLLDEVNKVLQEHNQETFKKEDLITIISQAVIFKALYPERELYLESAVIAISQVFPEYIDVYKEKLRFLTKTEEEKRTYFLNNLTLLFPNLSIEDQEILQQKYQDDNREFKDIGIEVIEAINEHKIEKTTDINI